MSVEGLGRPVVKPRGEMTPLGKILAERGISARAVGEAIALAEQKATRVLTGKVNEWIWGRIEPNPLRQRLLAKWLEVPVHDLFPPRPKRERPKPKPGKPDLQLLSAAAAEVDVDDEPAAAAHLARAVAQQEIPEARALGDVPCIIERKTARAVRRPRPQAQADRRAA